MQSPVPMFRRTLLALSSILAKAEAHCAAQKIDPAVLVASRLFPDMLPFARQVMIATDAAKGMVARLTGVENPSFPDVEATLPELRARIDACVAFLDSAAPGAFDAADTRDVVVKTQRGELHFKGAEFLAVWAIPNFYFHVTTAYNILRHNGVPVGKLDYLGG
jgi:uncharacterized protein